MNTITVYGRLASEVTTNDVGGRTVANFRVASQNRRKDKDGKYGTNFYHVAAWGALSDIASKYLKSGHRVALSGQLVIRPYTGSDGQQRQAIEIDADSIDLVETRAEAEAKSTATATAAPAPNHANDPRFTPVETDELPFD